MNLQNVNAQLNSLESFSIFCPMAVVLSTRSPYPVGDTHKYIGFLVFVLGLKRILILVFEIVCFSV